MFSTRRVAVVVDDRAAAEMLHTFFRLMELECALISHGSEAVPTLRRFEPDILILDLDLPDLRALDIAFEIRAVLTTLPIIFLSRSDNATVALFDAPVVAMPRGRFEEMLRLFEVVLELDRGC
jgi:DNA-binding response OmpR family regulator